MKEKSKWFSFFILGCVLFMAHVFVEYLVANKILITLGVV